MYLYINIQKTLYIFILCVCNCFLIIGQPAKIQFTIHSRRTMLKQTVTLTKCYFICGNGRL